MILGRKQYTGDALRKDYEEAQPASSPNRTFMRATGWTRQAAQEALEDMSFQENAAWAHMAHMERALDALWDAIAEMAHEVNLLTERRR